MRFTIFGASGFIGSNLVKYLSGLGHEVLTPKRLEIKDTKENLGNVIYAIGLTGNYRQLPPYEAVEAHVTILSKIIKQAAYDSWLYLSSTRIYQGLEGSVNETSQINVMPGVDGIYNISKLLGESLCLTLNHDKVRVVRLSNVYGVGQSHHTFLGSLINNMNAQKDLLIEEDFKSSKDYISISDVVTMLEKISINGSERIYNLASGLSTTHKDITGKISLLTGCSVSFKINAPHRTFPAINISRIKEEFKFIPRNIMDDLNKLFIDGKK